MAIRRSPGSGGPKGSGNNAATAYNASGFDPGSTAYLLDNGTQVATATVASNGTVLFSPATALLGGHIPTIRGQLTLVLPAVAGASSGTNPPTGYTYLMDTDGSRLTDADGAYLMEAL